MRSFPSNPYQFSLHSLLVILLLTLAACPATASEVSYNLRQWDHNPSLHQDGALPAIWTGASTPAYTGSLNTMWYSSLNAGETVSLSSADAVSKGADPLYWLAVGPKSWFTGSGNGLSGNGNGADFGLIHLDTSAHVSISVAADTSVASQLITGFTVYSGWDTGTTSVRAQSWNHLANNPLGSTGLNYLGSSSTAIAGGSSTLDLGLLAAGNYSLFIGGNKDLIGLVHDRYTATITASAVPLPAAAWLFASALAGFGLIGRRNKALVA